MRHQTKNSSSEANSEANTEAFLMSSRAQALLAKARRRQLDFALAGRILASLEYAKRADRIRRMAQPALMGLAVMALAAVPAFGQATVRTAEVEVGPIQAHQRVTGSLRAASRADIAVLEEGRITEVAVNEADRVEKGQVLARIDARRLAAQLDEARADADVTRARIDEMSVQLDLAQRDLTILNQLAANSAAHDKELRDARTAVGVAEARLNASERELERIGARVELLQVRLDDAVIRAPFDGRVVQRHAEPGEWLSAGDPVVTVVSTGMIEAWLETPERLADAVGAHANEITVDVQASGAHVASTRVRVVPQVDPRARTFAVVVEMDDQGGRFSPGMSVTAWVPAGQRDEYTSVPKDAVVRTARGAHVFLAGLDEAGQRIAVHTPVRILFETADRVVIGGDVLAPGDLVVIEGNQRLRPNTRLALATPAS